ncbi:MAG: tetratricopeptide repeat protein [Betaproteobacteria bacterium]
MSPLVAARRFAEIEALARNWTARFPHDATSWLICGAALQRQERYDEAIPFLQQAASLAPENAVALNDLGNAFAALGRYAEAEDALTAALHINPDYPEAYYHLGMCFMAQGRQVEAEKFYRRAIAIRPAFAEAHNNLGVLLDEQSRLGEAEASYRRALEANPQLPQAHNALGNNAKLQGRPDEALEHYRHALELNPDYDAARDNLLLTLNYFSGRRDEMLAEARTYGEVVSARAEQVFTDWTSPAQPARLKVGLVSGDLYSHPVGYFLDGVVEHLAGSSIDLFFYATVDHADELTGRLRRHAVAWRSLKNIPDAEAAALIHADGIQVLVDLAGHTHRNRLPLFARRPAPMQAAWLGYFATTGLASIDYVIADEMSVPENAGAQFVEQTWRLPDTRLCFTPPALQLHVAPAPAARNGFPTMGCFQSLSKISAPVIETWARILGANTEARLRMQCNELGKTDMRTAFAARLRGQGIDLNRVAFFGEMTRENYLASYAEVDLVLDTFPYPGGTTTCEALWMGVPTLTLAGESFLARQGASIMHAARMDEWITTSQDEYVGRALERLRDVAAWSGDRLLLRERALQTPLFDCRKFAGEMEKAWWGMWETWEMRQTRQAS